MLSNFVNDSLIKWPIYTVRVMSHRDGVGNYSRICRGRYGLFVYYESIKREVKRRPIYECRYDERLKTKTEESTRLGYTGFLGELEHLR
jgi:hypothetical protein